MGSNCLNSVVTDIEINSNESNDIISIQFKLFITSGGDDQSINIALFSFHYDISPVSYSSFYYLFHYLIIYFNMIIIYFNLIINFID